MKYLKTWGVTNIVNVKASDNVLLQDYLIWFWNQGGLYIVLTMSIILKLGFNIWFKSCSGNDPMSVTYSLLDLLYGDLLPKLPIIRKTHRLLY